jgi:putative DNA primase/helicase
MGSAMSAMPPAEDIASKLGRAQREGNSWRCDCPVCGAHAFLISDRTGQTLWHCFGSDCSQDATAEALRKLGAIPKAAAKPNGNGERHPREFKGHRPIREHFYADEAGEVGFCKCRYPLSGGDKFRPWSKVNGEWRMGGKPPAPYLLSNLKSSTDAICYFSEGERDADTLHSLGYTATSHKGWYQKWNKYVARFGTLVAFGDTDASGTGDDQVNKFDPGREVLRFSTAEVATLVGVSGKDISDLYAVVGGEKLKAAIDQRVGPITGGEAASEDAPAIPEFCDDAITLAFSKRHADDLRYCEAFGRWFEWDGGRWRPDDKRYTFTLARRLCRDKSAEALVTLNPKIALGVASAVASAKTVAAVVNLARDDERYATVPADWDADPWALNTPGGLVNLRTAEMRTADRKALCSKITAVAPAPAGTDCPLWRAFLDRIMAGDTDLIRFLQRLMGYALTGLTIEHVLAFLYGRGVNGKSVFLNTLTRIFGDYAKASPMETFTDSHSDRHPTELAMLKGARFVCAQETEEGRRWAESKIKALTGGDPIPARFMRMDFFEYIPQFTLLIAGNHKPSLRNIDEAIRRRFNLIPFAVTIPPEERDPNLAEKLKGEWPAILRWAIDGCLEWQRIGLAQPPAVVNATSEYFEQQNTFAQWIEEAIEIVPPPHAEDAYETSSALFANWKAWAERAGAPVGSMVAFTERMEGRGFVRKRHSKARGFNGLRIIRPDYSGDPRYGS